MNDLLSLAKRAQELTSQLVDSGYTGEFLEETVMDTLVEELINRTGQMDYNEVKKALRNMYFLGKVFREERE